MKISAHHKALGDTVEWWDGFKHYDAVYQAKVFTEEYSPDENTCINADAVFCGGTGYGLENKLPSEIEHLYPDYTLYPHHKEAYGFLTRGCPRSCAFCVVSQKEGRSSQRVADLSDFWRGTKIIKLLDPNLLACQEHENLLSQLALSGAWIDFTQGLDIRLVASDNIRLLNKVKTEAIHFAWDNPAEDLTPHFQLFQQLTTCKDYRKKTVYVLTNYGSTHEQDLHRVYTLRALGFTPFIMIYNKGAFVDSKGLLRPLQELLPKFTHHQIEHFIETHRLQRWVNNKRIFRSTESFSEFRGGY